MAESPLKEDIVNVSHSILLAGSPIKDTLDILSIEVSREINKVAVAKFVLLLEWGEASDKSFEPSDSDDFKAGKEVEIKAGYDAKEETIFKGIIVNQKIKARAGKRTELILNCSDKSVKMTLGGKTKYYANKTDSAILGSIIGEYGLSKEVEATSYTHKMLVKYDATDWDFTLARAQANGLLTYTEDGKVIVKKPLASGSAALVVNYDQDVYDFDGEIESRFQLPSATAQAWDMKTQKMVEGKSEEPTVNSHGDLTGKVLSDVIGLDDFELRNGGGMPTDELKNWANSAVLMSRLARIRGSVTFFGNEKPKLNTLLELAGFGTRFNGDALITKVYHRLLAGEWRTTVGFGLPVDWHPGNPAKGEFSGRAGVLPPMEGLHCGTVKKIDADPDGEHRIQVDVPVIAATGDGLWARLSNFYSTSGKGTFFMPEVGDEVVLGFLNNDPRFPIILGSLYSSKIKPAYTADAENSIKAFQTKNDLKIEFNDKDKILTVETPGGNKMILSDKDKSILLQDQNGNKVEMGSSGITLNSPKDISLKATGNIKLEATQKIDVKATADLGLAGLTVKANAQTSFSAQGGAQAELKSGGQTAVKGAMVMIN